MFITKKSRVVVTIIVSIFLITAIPVYVGLIFGMDDLEPGLLAGFAGAGILWGVIFAYCLLGVIMNFVYKWIKAGKEDYDVE